MAMRRMILQIDDHVADERLRRGSDDIAVKVLKEQLTLVCPSIQKVKM